MDPSLALRSRTCSTEELKYFFSVFTVVALLLN